MGFSTVLFQSHHHARFSKSIIIASSGLVGSEPNLRATDSTTASHHQLHLAPSSFSIARQTASPALVEVLFDIVVPHKSLAEAGWRVESSWRSNFLCRRGAPQTVTKGQLARRSELALLFLVHEGRGRGRGRGGGTRLKAYYPNTKDGE